MKSNLKKNILLRYFIEFVSILSCILHHYTLRHLNTVDDCRWLENTADREIYNKVPEKENTKLK